MLFSMYTDDFVEEMKKKSTRTTDRLGDFRAVIRKGRTQNVMYFYERYLMIHKIKENWKERNCSGANWAVLDCNAVTA